MLYGKKYETHLFYYTKYYFFDKKKDMIDWALVGISVNSII